MSDINGKVNYLRGLADGMKISEKTDEGRILTAIIEVLSDIAVEMQGTEIRLDDIEEDLADLEEEFYEDYDDDDDSFEVTCDKCGLVNLIEAEDWLEEEPLKCEFCTEEIDLSCDCDDCAPQCGGGCCGEMGDE